MKNKLLRIIELFFVIFLVIMLAGCATNQRPYNFREHMIVNQYGQRVHVGPDDPNPFDGPVVITDSGRIIY